MKIAMMSCMLGNVTPREAVDAAVYCGLDAIDWVGMCGSDAKTLKKLSADAGIRIVTHTMLDFEQKFMVGKENYMDDFKVTLDNACEMGAPLLMLPPFPRQCQVSLADDYARWTEYFIQAQELVSRAGILLSVESTGFSNSPIVTGDEVRRLLDRIPELRVSFDQGNTMTADDPVSAYGKVRERVVRFHLKDWKITDSPHPGSELKRCGKYFSDVEIGKGDADVKGFWDCVAPEQKAECWCNLETRDFTGKVSPRDAIKRVAEKLKSW